MDDGPVEPSPGRIRASALGLLILVLAQIYLGALVAGLRAGYVYNSWPLIDGAVVPETVRLFLDTPIWRNFFENTLTVQFDHRMLAYAIWVFALVHVFDVAGAAREKPPLVSAVVLVLAVTVQAALGVWTLLLRVPVELALMHQAMAMVVLTAATVHAAYVAVRIPRAIAAPVRA
jgi:heme a synthase